MQLVEIKYDKTETSPKIFIKNEEISEFMALKSLVHNDIFTWADKFFASVDEEIGEAYRVVVTGHPFHKVVLDACMEKSKYCEEIQLNEHKRTLSLADKYQFAVQKSKIYFPNKQAAPDCLTIKCDSAEHFSQLDLPNVTLSQKDCPYHLLTEKEAWDCSSSKYRIVLSSDNLVRKQSTKYNLFVTKENLAVALDYFNCYHLMLPYVKEFFDAIKEKPLTDEAKCELDAYLLEEYRIFAPDIPSKMDVDKQYPISYKVFPHCQGAPKILLVSSDKEIARCDGNVIRPLQAGTFALSFVDEAGSLYLSKNIQSLQHNYVKNIEIHVPSFAISPDEILDFSCDFSPSDAEDVEKVQYIVSNPSVAAITDEKKLRALSPGRIKVTIKSELIEKSFFVSVLPPLADIILSSESVSMPYNSDVFIHCSLVPHNASPVPKFTWVSSNPKIAKVVPTENHGCKIVGKRFGECFVTCTVDGTNISKRITVTIKNGTVRTDKK